MCDRILSHGNRNMEAQAPPYLPEIIIPPPYINQGRWRNNKENIYETKRRKFKRRLVQTFRKRFQTSRN